MPQLYSFRRPGPRLLREMSFFLNALTYGCELRAVVFQHGATVAKRAFLNMFQVRDANFFSSFLFLNMFQVRDANPISSFDKQFRSIPKYCVAVFCNIAHVSPFKFVTQVALQTHLRHIAKMLPQLYSLFFQKRAVFQSNRLRGPQLPRESSSWSSRGCNHEDFFC